eukprot:8747603-Alexandrium_andersonii.AAC.1
MRSSFRRLPPRRRKERRGLARAPASSSNAGVGLREPPRRASPEVPPALGGAPCLAVPTPQQPPAQC